MPVSAVTAGNVVINDVAVCVGARCTDAAYRCCVQMLCTLLTCAVALCEGRRCLYNVHIVTWSIFIYAHSCVIEIAKIRLLLK